MRTSAAGVMSEFRRGPLSASVPRRSVPPRGSAAVGSVTFGAGRTADQTPAPWPLLVEFESPEITIDEIDEFLTRATRHPMSDFGGKADTQI